MKALLALDSIDGHKVPNERSIRSEIQKAAGILNQMQGISNAKTQVDTENYIFEITCNFANVKALDEGIYQTLNSLIQTPQKTDIQKNHFVFQNQRFERNFPLNPKPEFEKLPGKYKDVLKEAIFTAIYRFPKSIKSKSNQDAKVSKTGKASMLRYSLYQIASEQKTIQNTIILNQ
ncbi:hypothetical protein AAG747_14445 [Rapidithrix thailandica]|uniref:LAGLIDADG homing endonuclease n=1 Tax=Rapidithrix thailandica TaxID=413964 RepID=A0AAW9RWD7_9BACT